MLYMKLVRINPALAESIAEEYKCSTSTGKGTVIDLYNYYIECI